MLRYASLVRTRDPHPVIMGITAAGCQVTRLNQHTCTTSGAGINPNKGPREDNMALCMQVAQESP